MKLKGSPKELELQAQPGPAGVTETTQHMSVRRVDPWID